ncbi:hypothetical protein BKA56DRAFT_674618 [Ilyonectria sp. MPI-CAGE-AT-0026]|nr:hypothetical protein BKA56DRAFT_674618 [Ilyonectria sp. MPI-CAGE-AT-0026]
MGLLPSREAAPMEGEGCWYTKNPPHSSTGDPMEGLLALLPQLVGMENEGVDCDCHFLGTCMPGEPPLPPLDEFIMDINLNPDWVAKPAHFVEPRIPNAHTYRPKQWGSYGLPGGTVLGHDLPGQYTGRGPFKRDLENVEPKFERAVILPNLKDVPLKGDFTSLILKAYYSLSEAKQKAVLKSWPEFEPFTEYMPKIYYPDYYEIDPRPTLAILLADPRGRAGNAARAMDPKFANLILRCADKTIQDLMYKVLEESIDDKPSKEIPGSGDDVAIKRLQYYEVLKHYAVLWHSHTPPGLDRALLDADSFRFQVKRGKKKGFEVLHSKDICRTVTEGALSNLKKHASSYMADYGDIMGSLDQHMKSKENNSFVDALHLPDTLQELAQDLDWRPETLATLFESSWPELHVAMGYFVLSLWTGVGRLGIDMK